MSEEAASVSKEVKLEESKEAKFDLYVMRAFHPYYEGKNSMHTNDKFSQGFFFAFKLRKKPAQPTINAVLNYCTEMKMKCDAICLVPGHEPGGGSGPLHNLVVQLSKMLGAVDCKDLVQRVRPVDKLAQGGARKVEIHLGSIELLKATADGLKGKTVLLVDDVVTSGNSFIACASILRKAGIKVIAFAIGQTCSSLSVHALDKCASQQRQLSFVDID